MPNPMASDVRRQPVQSSIGIEKRRWLHSRFIFADNTSLRFCFPDLLGDWVMLSCGWEY